MTFCTAEFGVTGKTLAVQAIYHYSNQAMIIRNKSAMVKHQRGRHNLLVNVHYKQKSLNAFLHFIAKILLILATRSNRDFLEP